MKRVRLPEPGRPAGRGLEGARLLVAALGVVLVVAGCGGEGETKATQVVAQVNGDEISVHQVNHVLQRTPGVTIERAAEARKAILERLIEQQVLVQAASDAKLDRNPEVLQRLEAARREILARAWLERVAAGVPRPDAKAVSEYFRSQPQLFQERKVYKFDEIVLSRRPANWSEIEKSLLDVKSVEEAAAALLGHGIDAPVAGNSTRAAEQIPLAILPRLEGVKEGDVIIYPQAAGVVIAEVRSIRVEPVDEKRATPVIEQFLVNRTRNELVKAEVKRLRQTAEVVYVGEFAATAASSATDAAVDPAQAAAPEDLPGVDARERSASASTTSVQADPNGGERDFGLEQGVKGLR